MIRTFIALRRVDPGFVRPKEVQTFRVSMPKAVIEDPQHVVLAYEQIARHLEQVPGVVSVGLSSSVTMDRNSGKTPIFVEGFPEAGRALPPIRGYKRVAPGYFETMGNPVLSGRAITWTDIYQARPVVLISESLAREYWKNPADALGKRVTQSQENPWREIIGVVGNERDDGLDHAATAVVYWPMLIKQWWNEPIDIQRTMAYVVRSARVGSSGFLRELQQAVWLHQGVLVAVAACGAGLVINRFIGAAGMDALRSPNDALTGAVIWAPFGRNLLPVHHPSTDFGPVECLNCPH